MTAPVDEPGRLGPLPDAADDPAAAALVRSLRADVEALRPRDRLGEVRGQVRRARRRSWGQVAVAGVAAAAVVGTVAVLHERPSRVSAARPTPVASPSSSDRSGVVRGPLPVYYLGRDGDRWALYREFHRRTPAGGQPTDPMAAAVRAAITAGSALDADLSAPWSGAAARAELSLEGDVLTVDLPASEGQPQGRTPEQARLAVQQLVWTATAVRQDAGLGVRLLLGGRPGRLFGAVAVGEVVWRTSPSYQVLGSVWVEAPDEGQQVAPPVTVRGSACTLEASVSWQLLRGGVVQRSGHTTASSGCPTRGAWSVRLGQLEPGRYTLRAFEPPASGAGPDREDTRTFTVR